MIEPERRVEKEILEQRISGLPSKEPVRIQTIQRIKQIFAERKTGHLRQPLSAEVTLDDFIASVLPERKSSLHRPRKNKARQGVEVKLVGL